MKPVYLKMTAFGSYCGTAEVDFTKLYDNGIFLITGKTGGGKTTILDAMCVALYGKATGSERAKEWKNLRCNNAPSGVDTEIEYIFSIDGTKYKFYRRWHLPNSKKGEPKLEDKESACYLCSNDSQDWELIASRSAKAVNEAAESILKLTHTQFVKVIMLPQGEFRELLTASSDEKEAIFKKLFDTERWERITDRISEEYRDIEKQCSEHKNRKDIALKSTECETVDQLRANIENCRHELEQLQLRSEENNKRAEQTAAELKSAEETAAMFAELTSQRNTLKNLTAESTKFADIEAKFVKSRRLRCVLSQFNLMKAAQDSVADCSKELGLSEKAKRIAAAELEKTRKNCEQLPYLEEKRNQLQAAASSLDELAGSRAQYSDAIRKSESDEASLKSEEQELETLLKQKSETESSISKGNSFLEQCHEAGRELTQANETLHKLEQQLNLTKEFEQNAADLSSVEKQIAASDSEIKRLEHDCETSRAIVSAVERAIMADKAYSLSAGLTEGTPCPVCGSIHHPNPAQPAHSTPTTADLDKCKEDADKCAKKLDNERANYASLSTQYDILCQSAEQLRQKWGGSFDKPSAEIKVELDEANKRVDKLQKLSDKTDKAQNKLSLLNNKLAANTHDIEKANTNINNLKIQIATARQTVNSLTERLRTQNILSFDELDKQLNQIKTEINSTDSTIKKLNESHSAASSKYSAAEATLDAAKKGLAEAVNQRNTRQDEFFKKCAELGIDRDSDIEGGVLSEKNEEELERKLSEHKSQLDFAQRRTDELLEELDGKQMPDLEGLRRANNAAIEAGKEIAHRCGDISSRLKFLEDAAATVNIEEEALTGLQQKYDTARRMSQLLSGANGSHTPIHQYVIGIKMDEVIISANLYMTKLTRGQYAMKRKDSIGGRARHQGLDIEIIDSVAGRERAISTLSGGELFLASLSLAFGLSDVVQSFAGGIHLDSLFIDEGFGSLDSETLDIAMDAITQVRENKLLGIISHVSELKERIPHGIEVIKMHDGSSLKMRI